MTEREACILIAYIAKLSSINVAAGIYRYLDTDLFPSVSQLKIS